MRSNLLEHLRKEMEKAEKKGDMERYYELRGKILKWS